MQSSDKVPMSLGMARFRQWHNLHLQLSFVSVNRWLVGRSRVCAYLVMYMRASPTLCRVKQHSSRQDHTPQATKYFGVAAAGPDLCGWSTVGNSGWPTEKKQSLSLAQR